MNCFICGQGFVDGSLTSVAEHLYHDHNWRSKRCDCGVWVRRPRTIERHLQINGIIDRQSYDKHVELRESLVACWKELVSTQGPLAMGRSKPIDGIHVEMYTKRLRSNLHDPNPGLIPSSVTVEVFRPDIDNQSDFDIIPAGIFCIPGEANGTKVIDAALGEIRRVRRNLVARSLKHE